MATTPGPAAVSEYVETYLPEDEPLQNARSRAAELGCPPVSPATGALLRFLSSVINARSVVEIGTGAGISGLWLLRGMRSDGVLTTVDVAADNHRAARQTFSAAGIASTRVRLINGAALDVLPRLTDAAYDLVFADGVKSEYDAYLIEAIRLLRPGGVVAFDNMTWSGKVADPGARDAETVAIRDLARAVRERADLVPALVSVGDGLLAAVYRPDLAD